MKSNSSTWDCVPENPTEEDFIPESILNFSERNHIELIRNSDDAIIPIRVLNSNIFDFVAPELLNKVLVEIEKLIPQFTYIFPIDIPYIANYILKAKEHGIENPESIAKEIVLSMKDEGITIERGGPFIREDKIEVSIVAVIELISGLNRYIVHAMKNGEYKREIGRITVFISDLLHIISMESTSDSWEPWNAKAPGYQKILVPRAGLFVVIRVFESAARMFETELWKTNLFWTSAFRKQAHDVRRIISRWDEEQS